MHKDQIMAKCKNLQKENDKLERWNSRLRLLVAMMLNRRFRKRIVVAPAESRKLPKGWDISIVKRPGAKGTEYRIVKRTEKQAEGE